MDKLRITVNKGSNPEYEAMFDNLIQETFGFSFSPWFALKLWDERYESYSIIENGKMLSNVCIYKSEMIVLGETVRANQFGAIATRKSARGRGLARLLMEHVLSLYPDTLAYLAANSSVIDFYPRFGFKQIQIYKPEIAAKINNDSDKAVKYKLNDPTFMSLLNARGDHSKMLDCINAQPIQMFHLIMEYADDIYYLPSLDVVVIAEQDGNRLFLADVIAKKPVAFELLKQALPFEGIETVAFGFCPDWLDVTPTWTPLSMKEEPFFIRGDWRLPENYRFPAMSET